MRPIDADRLLFHSCNDMKGDCPYWGSGNCYTCQKALITKADIDNAPTIISDEAIVLDFTNITEEQKQQLVNLLSKTRIKAINKDVIWQNGYYACLNDKSIRESNWIPVSERLPEDMQSVLIWFEYYRYGDYNCMYQTYGFCHVFDGKWSSFINGKTGWRDARIIAWMPLPEAYKEAENE